LKEERTSKVLENSVQESNWT